MCYTYVPYDSYVVQISENLECTQARQPADFINLFLATAHKMTGRNSNAPPKGAWLQPLNTKVQMNTAELSFLILSLFMIHEFEEIITIRNWIQKNKNNKKLSNEMFIKGKKHYQSTETISLMIMEEFVLISIILFTAIRLQIAEIAVGLFIAYSLHLFGHIFQCIKFRKWTPGSRTALITILPVFYIVYITFATNNLNAANTAIWSVALSIALLLNLLLMFRYAGKIENWQKNF